MRRFAIAVLTVLALPASASAAGWSAVALPARSELSSVSCRSTSWCEAVGGDETGHWNGRAWTVRHDLPKVRGGSLTAIACRSTRSCAAVGEAFPRETQPIGPLIERWDGRRWRVEAAPKPQPARGDRGVNTVLKSVACPGARLCFAVGQAVAFGAGNAPGQPLVERWNGRYWSVALVPYAPSPLTSISCTSARACTAVGGFEYVTGRPEADNVQSQYANAVERWNGSGWSLGALTPPAAGQIDGLLGVSCTSATACLGVGSEEDTTTYADQALAGTSGDGKSFSTSPLAFPSSVERGGTSSPSTVLSAIACAPTDPDFCGAVGRYTATNGAIGPLAAIWNGSTWTQVALRRGPVQLTSVSCPALGWCIAVGGGIAERFR